MTIVPQNKKENEIKNKQRGKVNVLVLVIFIVVIIGIVVLIFKGTGVVSAQFCNKIITEAQLREITDYNGSFVFKDTRREILENGIIGVCDFQSEDLKIIGAITFFPLENTYTTYEKLKQEFIDIVERKIPAKAEEIRDIDNIGEQAFLISINDIFHQLFFEDRNNQIVGLITEGLNYDVFIEIARQIEINVKQKF